MLRPSEVGPEPAVALVRHWITSPTLIGAWLLIGIYQTSQSIMMSSWYGRDVVGLRTVAFFLLSAGSWAVVSPFLFLIASRLPLGKHSLLRLLTVIVPVSVIVVIGKFAFDAVLFPRLFPDLGSTSALYFERAVIGRFHPTLLDVWAIIAIGYAIEYWKRYKERELRESQLETRLAQAQLDVLRSQLNPHFLFNTLHAISALIYRDPDAADRMISRLSDLLRLSIESVGRQEATLREEIEFLERYLDIEQVRFGDRLQVSVEVDGDVLDSLVPGFLLQPLVENAVRHGVEMVEGAGAVRVVARKMGERLAISIHNDGPQLDTKSPRERIGIGNTRGRLQQLFGENHAFELANHPAGGVVVSMTFPCRRASSAAVVENESRQDEGATAGALPPRVVESR